MALRLENPKWDQNPWFIPLRETANLPDLSIWESPTPGVTVSRRSSFFRFRNIIFILSTLREIDKTLHLKNVHRGEECVCSQEGSRCSPSLSVRPLDFEEACGRSRWFDLLFTLLYFDLLLLLFDTGTILFNPFTADCKGFFSRNAYAWHFFIHVTCSFFGLLNV